MKLLREQFATIAKDLSKSPDDFMHNVRMLVKNHGFPRKVAMAVSFAVIASGGEKDEHKESYDCISRFLLPEEIEDSVIYAEKLDDVLVVEQHLDSFSSEFRASVTHSPQSYSRSSDEFKPQEAPWYIKIQEIHFGDGDRFQFTRFKRKASTGAFPLSAAGKTEQDAVNELKQRMQDVGLKGQLVVRNESGKKYTVELEPEPRKVAVETTIRRFAVNFEHDELNAVSEIDAIMGKKPTLVEQRPAVKDVIVGVEDTMTKAILVSIANMLRQLGYERWPTDPEGKEDIDNVIDALSTEMNNFGRRMSSLVKDQIKALKKIGPESYEAIFKNWLQGLPAEDEKGKAKAKEEEEPASKEPEPQVLPEPTAAEEPPLEAPAEDGEDPEAIPEPATDELAPELNEPAPETNESRKSS